MILLTLFAFLGGVVTILSPCILPILPIVLSSSLTGGKRRPLGVVTGFIVSFTFFTLFLSFLVKALGISAESLRTFSIIVILLFGISFLTPKFQELLEKLFSSFSRFSPKANSDSGYWGGVVIGLSIGLLWTPCVGPILASIISLALSGSVSSQAIIITFSYALGTAIPMLGIVWGGRNLLNKVPWLVSNTTKIQKGFGVLMIITAIAIYSNFDRNFQVWVLNRFPSYGTGLTKVEDNAIVKNALDSFKVGSGENDTKSDEMGKPLFQVRKDGPQAPEIIPGGQWFNVPQGQASLKISDLRGKVVMVDFWTYTCINCIRTLPYMRDWHDKYADKGLVIIGVHTPEFEFEKTPSNVAKAIKDFDLKYPIVQDNNYATWRAYNNHYWPAKYLIDKDGVIRYTHFGEGEYDKTEKVIQQLLEEAGSNVSNVNLNTSTYSIDAQTQETYLGNFRLQYLASPETVIQDKQINYSKPANLTNNYFALEGFWTIANETAMPEEGSKLYFNFSAKNVYLVMRPKNENAPGKVKVYLNGKIVDSENDGEDVKAGVVTVDSDRLYKLLNIQTPGRNELKLEFLDSNLEVYAFTFG